VATLIPIATKSVNRRIEGEKAVFFGGGGYYFLNHLKLKKKKFTKLGHHPHSGMTQESSFC
jgi:hypothetical protein